MSRFGRFFRWVRRLLPLPHPDPRKRAAHPDPSQRKLHLMQEGVMRSACDGTPASATNWVTVQLDYVTCPRCRAMGRRRAAVRNTRFR